MGYLHPDYTRTYTVVEGRYAATLHVEILPAVEESVGYQGKHVMVPHLRLTTQATYDDQSNPITIRGRDYQIDIVHKLHEGGTFGADFKHYGSRGLTAKHGQTVDYKAAAHETLTALAELARDRLVEELPDWQNRSTLRAFTEQAAKAQENAAKLRAQADAEDDRAASLLEQADALNNELS